MMMVMMIKLLTAKALTLIHTRHILPPSEIDLGLFWAGFAGSEGKKLFHRIGRKSRTWQP